LASSPQIDYSGEARLGMDHNSAAQWKASLQGCTAHHFITECFFLTAHAVHLSAEPVLKWLEAVKHARAGQGSKEKVLERLLPT
jgi:hypothetical protein